LSNFVKNKPVTAELIEVDYLKEFNVTPPVDLYLNLVSSVQNGCEITFTVDTNIPQPFQVEVLPYSTTFGISGFLDAPYILNPKIYGTVSGNQLTYNFTEIPENSFGYKFSLIWTNTIFQTISTLLSQSFQIAQSCYVPSPPPAALLSFITITNVTSNLVANGMRTIQLDYVSDLTAPFMDLLFTANANQNVFGFYQQSFLLAVQNGSVTILVHDQNFAGGTAVYNCFLSASGVTSNVVVS
jgi:hypothetical protein